MEEPLSASCLVAKSLKEKARTFVGLDSCWEGWRATATRSYVRENQKREAVRGCGTQRRKSVDDCGAQTK